MIKYTIRKGKHYCNWAIWYKIIFLWCFKKKFNFEFEISKEAWRPKSSVTYSGINKVVGWTFFNHAEKPFGKWCLTKWTVNSLIVGFQSDHTKKYKFNIHNVNDNRGVEDRPYAFSIMAEDKISGIISRTKTGMQIIYNVKGSNVPYKFEYPMNYIPFGYRINPFFGGKDTAYETFTINLKT